MSDIYAIGAMLFWITIGRPPTTNEVIHAGGNWQIRAKDLINIDISNLPSDFITHVRNIFNRTLCRHIQIISLVHLNLTLSHFRAYVNDSSTRERIIVRHFLLASLEMLQLA